MTTGSRVDDGERPSPSVDRDGFREQVGGEGFAVGRIAFPLSAQPDPLATFATLAGGEPDTAGFPRGALLESVPKVASSDPRAVFGEDAGVAARARYSFVAFDPVARLDVEGGSVTANTPTGSTPSDRFPIDAIDPPSDADTFEGLRSIHEVVDASGVPPAERQRAEGGLVGFVASEAIHDPWLAELGRERPETGLPDASFHVVDRTVVFDHRAGDVSLVLTPIIGPERDPNAVYDRALETAERVSERLAETDGAVETARKRADGDRRAGRLRPIEDREGPDSRAAFESAVERAGEAIRDGEVYQAVVSRSRRYEGRADPIGLYETLRAREPAPYSSLVSFDDVAVVGASPEALVTVRGPPGRREVVLNPIAGTTGRGGDPAGGTHDPIGDRRLAGELLADPKERAEHVMLVDLARNDAARVAESGTVGVDEFMRVRKYGHVQHIESTVSARLAADADAVDALRAAFPAGTLVGAPKRRATELVTALEATPRGVYGGGVGYLAWDGTADLAIAIRSATLRRGATAARAAVATDAEDPEADLVTIRAGAGIVADSEPATEYRETERKLAAIAAAVERHGGLDAVTADEIAVGGTSAETGDAEGPAGRGQEVATDR